MKNLKPEECFYFFDRGGMIKPSADLMGLLMTVSWIEREIVFLTSEELVDKLMVLVELREKNKDEKILAEKREMLKANLVLPFDERTCEVINNVFTRDAEVIFIGSVYAPNKALVERAKRMITSIEGLEKESDEGLKEMCRMYDVGELLSSEREIDYMMARIGDWFGGDRPTLINYDYSGPNEKEFFERLRLECIANGGDPDGDEF
jgi:hypothetical protein